MRRLLLMIMFACIALGSSCTWSTSGGTTDTGNARVAAVIYTPDGERAANAVVTICAENYTSPLNDDNSSAAHRRLRTVTNDTGYFSISEINNGTWFVEVNDLMASAIRFGVIVDSTKKPGRIDTTLAPYATLSGNVGAADDSLLERYCVIEGLDRRIPIGSDGSFSVDDLPGGLYTCRIVASDDDWEERNFEDVMVHSGESVMIATPAPEYDTVHITLNTSVSGAEVTETVTNFPVLLRLDSTAVDFDNAGENGESMRFFSRNDSILSFTVVQWNPEVKKAMVWVVVDTVFGNDSLQEILMVYGDTTISHAHETLFDTLNGHLACYHFDNDVKNAVRNGFDGADSGSDDTIGIIGRARAFNGKSAYISIGELPDRESGTISFWFRTNGTVTGALSSTQGIWGKKLTDSIDYTISLQGTDFWPAGKGAGALITKQETADTGYYLASSRRSYEAGVWYHAVWSWGNGGDSLYVNGTLEATESASLTMGGGGNEEIGRSYFDDSNVTGSGPGYFHGSLDEFRIDAVCRSFAWAKLSYMNQREDDRLIVIRR